VDRQPQHGRVGRTSKQRVAREDYTVTLELPTEVSEEPQRGGGLAGGGNRGSVAVPVCLVQVSLCYVTACFTAICPKFVYARPGEQLSTSVEIA